MSYDALGNIRTKIIGVHVLGMNYDSKNRLTDYTYNIGGDKSLGYDTRGNVTQLGGLFFTYDKSDQPVNISGTAAGTYRYDGHKRRVKGRVDGKTIYNIYDAAGTLVQVDNVTDGEVTDYIRAGGKSIARIITSGGADSITYLHNDHLGSASTGTSANGLVSWREQYTPFGRSLNSPLSNNDRDSFTGHIKDSATGLTYMQARYYDPLIGRFLSIDPVGFSPGAPEMFGRYTYTGNDPINLLDPTGRSSNYASRIFNKSREQSTQDLNDFTTGLAQSSSSQGGARTINDTNVTSIGDVDRAVGDTANITLSGQFDNLTFISDNILTGGALDSALDGNYVEATTKVLLSGVAAGGVATRGTATGVNIGGRGLVRAVNTAPIVSEAFQPTTRVFGTTAQGTLMQVAPPVGSSIPMGYYNIGRQITVAGGGRGLGVALVPPVALYYSYKAITGTSHPDQVR